MNRMAAIILIAAALPAGCREGSPAAGGPKPRVVSYSPALTEMIFDMGLGEHVVGVTSYCILPEGETRPAVGSRLGVSAEAVLSVRPDVVLIQQDESDFRAVKDVAPEVAVHRFRIETIADVADAMTRIGELLGQAEPAQAARRDFLARLEAVRTRVEGLARPKVMFVMGYERPVVAGMGSFIDDLIDVAGGVNVGRSVPGSQRWRPVNVEAILKASPEVLVCQVQPGREQAAREFWLKLKADLPAARDGRIFTVTNRHWSIPTGRLAALAEELAAMVHPDAAGGKGGDD